MRLARPAVAAAGSFLVAAALSGASPAAAPVSPAGSPAQASALSEGIVTIRPGAVHALTGASPAPPTTAFCERHYHIACYLPGQIRQAYNIPTNEFIVGDTGPTPLAGGGGRSLVFGRPWYQSGVRRIVGGSRGVPDIAMSGACNGAVDMYQSFGGQPAGSRSRW